MPDTGQIMGKLPTLLQLDSNGLESNICFDITQKIYRFKHSCANFQVQYSCSLVSECKQGKAVMCDWAMMFSLSQLTSPYFDPCLFQYNLLVAMVLLTMWTHAARVSVSNGWGVLVVVFTIVSPNLTFILITSDPRDHPDLSPTASVFVSCEKYLFHVFVS